MTIRLQLCTGDVTMPSQSPIELALEKNTPADFIVLRFKGQTAELRRADWPRLVEIVRRREPSRWRSERLLPALADLPKVHALLKLTTTTPSYQLLLAGIDLALAIRVVEDDEEAAVFRRFADLSEGTLPSFTGSGGLFLLPRDLIPQGNEEDIEDLLRENKLGKAALSLNEEDPVIRFYIPYAVPIGLEEARASARQLWEIIRNYYYAFRNPLAVR